MSKLALRRDKLAFDDPEALQALCGTNNTRLKLIERTAGAQLHLRGNEITIEADDDVVRVVRSALEQLYGFARKGKHLASDDVVRAVKVLSADSGAELAPMFTDTVLVPPGGTERLAFVARTPGRWMIGARILEHLAGGQFGWYEVA